MAERERVAEAIEKALVHDGYIDVDPHRMADAAIAAMHPPGVPGQAEEELERLRGVLAVIRAAPEHAAEYADAALAVLRGQEER